MPNRPAWSVFDFIERHVLIDEGCWLWAGSKNNGGYGRLCLTENKRERDVMAHRAVYELLVGPIPAGLVLDHLCRTHLCVRPSHLDPVTDAENIARSPIAPAALNATKTRCPKGHPYDVANTRFTKDRGGSVKRYCRACGRAKANVARHRRSLIGRSVA